VEQTGHLGAAGPAAALLFALEKSQPGQGFCLVAPAETRTASFVFQVREVPRVVGPAQMLDEGTVVDAGVALQVRRAWVDARDQQPRGAYVPLGAFRSQDAARLRLVGQKCTTCDRLVFPPRERCSHCGLVPAESHGFSGEGEVHSWTRIQKGGAPAEFAPLQAARGSYAVAVVELKEGPRVAAMLTGPALDGSDVSIGSMVRLVPRLVYVQEGTPRYSFKALLVDPPEERDEEQQSL
jgi:uncharacterized OB-fold protein